jgi:uncharacterized protein (TIGR01244 family)
MDIRELTNDFSVSPQVQPSDMAAVAAAGFKTVICNRPDHEVGADVCSAAIRQAAEDAGLAWYENIILGNGMTMDNVVEQGRLAAEADGPVFAYCRSGTRSATAWALAQAGQMPVDEIISTAARAGYDLAPMRAQIAAMADAFKG